MSYLRISVYCILPVQPEFTLEILVWIWDGLNYSCCVSMCLDGLLFFSSFPLLFEAYTQNIKFGTVINRKYLHAVCVSFSKMRISEFDPQLISSCKFPSTTFQNTNKFSWQSKRESPTVQPLTPEPDAPELLSYFFSVRSHDWQKCCTDIHVFWNRRRGQRGCCNTKQRGWAAQWILFNKALGLRWTLSNTVPLTAALSGIYM